MITIKNEKITDIPVLIVEMKESMLKPLPIVIYYHGFYGQKADSLTIAYHLASQGMRVVLPDSPMHGERSGHFTQTEIELSFWDIVLQNVKEIAQIKNYLTERHLIQNHYIGLGGTSMGGITTSAALTQYDWIKVGAVAMGSPNLTKFAHLLIDVFNKGSSTQISLEEKLHVIETIKPFDLSLKPESLNGRPLMFWHGEDDPVVPLQLAYEFYEKNKKLYNTNKDFKFVREPGRAHTVSRLAVSEISDWFCQHLIDFND